MLWHLLAWLTTAREFDDSVFDSKAKSLRILMDKLFNFWVFDFFGVSAGLTNEKYTSVIALRVLASNVGIPSFNTRCDALVTKKIERSINAGCGDLAISHF